jgi:tetratricopeptide (TPR) repeat protein
MYHLFKIFLILLLTLYSSPLSAQEKTGSDPPKAENLKDLYDLFGRGEDHLFHWEIKEAEAVSQELLRSHGDCPEAVYLTARVRFYQGNYTEAMKLLEGPAMNFPEGRQFYSFLSRIYETAKGFKEYPTEHFLFRCVPGRDEVLLDYAQEALERAYQEIGRDLECFPGEKVIVEVYPTVDSFSAASTLTPKEIETSGTVAICHFNRLMVLSPRLLLRGYPWMDTLAHEYVHYLITTKTRNLTPIWFHEGLAKYEESRWKYPTGRALTPIQSHLLAQAMERNYFISFEEMHPSLAKLKSGEDAALAFAEVLTAIRYIVDSGGYPLLVQILKDIGEGKEVEEAVSKGLGMPFEIFQREWLDYLQALDLKKIPGLQLLPLKIKEAGKKEDSPTEIEAEEARKFTMLGDLLQEEDRADAALLEYEKAREHSGLGSPQVLNKLSMAYILNRRLEEAEKTLEEARSYYPYYVTTYITLGELHRKRDDKEKAIEGFEEAARINPFNPLVHQRLASLYTASDKREEAEKALQRLAIILKEEMPLIEKPSSEEGPKPK